MGIYKESVNLAKLSLEEEHKGTTHILADLYYEYMFGIQTDPDKGKFLAEGSISNGWV